MAPIPGRGRWERSCGVVVPYSAIGGRERQPTSPSAASSASTQLPVGGADVPNSIAGPLRSLRPHRLLGDGTCRSRLVHAGRQLGRNPDHDVPVKPLTQSPVLVLPLSRHVLTHQSLELAHPDVVRIDEVECLFRSLVELTSLFWRKHRAAVFHTTDLRNCAEGSQGIDENLSNRSEAIARSVITVGRRGKKNQWRRSPRPAGSRASRSMTWRSAKYTVSSAASAG
jgi:hypothetical protein